MDRSKYCAATDTGVAPQVRKMSGDGGESHHGEGDTVLLRFHLCLGMHLHGAESACVFTGDSKVPQDLHITDEEPSPLHHDGDSGK